MGIGDDEAAEADAADEEASPPTTSGRRLLSSAAAAYGGTAYGVVVGQTQPARPYTPHETVETVYTLTLRVADRRFSGSRNTLTAQLHGAATARGSAPAAARCVAPPFRLSRRAPHCRIPPSFPVSTPTLS